MTSNTNNIWKKLAQKPENIIRAILMISIVLVTLPIIINYENFLNNSSNNSLSWFIILLEIPIAFGVTYVFWYLITLPDRKNKKYVRGKIKDNYQRRIEIAKNLRDDQSERRNMSLWLDEIELLYAADIHIMEIHARLLDADEIEECRHEQEVTRFVFINPLQKNPNDNYKIADLVEFFNDVMNFYVKTYVG
ncbi:MAG: hypothetical protein EB828_05715 [Nitrosopumilus sp. D6]|nr:MAG: hypothetical protein EB828_05715 [Nitrosopumilus sp. D6]